MSGRLHGDSIIPSPVFGREWPVGPATASGGHLVEQPSSIQREKRLPIFRTSLAYNFMVKISPARNAVWIFQMAFSLYQGIWEFFIA